MGLVVIYIRGVTTEYITGWLINREKAKQSAADVTSEPATA